MSAKKVLLVDDHVLIRSMMEQAFRRAGFMFWSAESAEDALKIIQSENINVMFLDLNLPGMSGVELCAVVRKQNPTAIIHAITGYAESFKTMDYKEAGFDDYFTKPVELKALLEAAQEAYA